MGKKVLLVGHCGPDSSYLRMSVKRALNDIDILMADDSAELAQQLEKNQIDLILFNRELGYGFETDKGVDVIRSLRPTQPKLKMMLVSNYPEAQQAAVAAGALPGFGKRELGSSRVTSLLKEALADEAAK